MIGGLKRYNIVIGGRRTSVRLEPSMFDALVEIALREGISVPRLCTRIEDRLRTIVGETREAGRRPPTLSSAIRVFSLAYFRVAATETGHRDNGHGTGGNLFRGTPLDTGVRSASGDPRQTRRAGG